MFLIELTWFALKRQLVRPSARDCAADSDLAHTHSAVLALSWNFFPCQLSLVSCRSTLAFRICTDTSAGGLTRLGPE
jgi:hypothetical protein